MILFIHVASRRIIVTPSTMHPVQRWVAQQARNFSMERAESNEPATHVLRDRDRKFHDCWDHIIESEPGSKSLILPRCSPNLNAFAERAIQSLKQECLNHFVIFGQRHLDYLVNEYVEFYNRCRPHSSRGCLPPIRNGPIPTEGEICCDERLGGLLKHYYRKAA